MTSTIKSTKTGNAAHSCMTLKDVPDLIRQRRPFRIANLWAIEGPFDKCTLLTGRLSPSVQRMFYMDKPTYIIYSYHTPIAWVGKVGAFLPSVTYSPTTSRHQALARMGLDMDRIPQ